MKSSASPMGEAEPNHMLSRAGVSRGSLGQGAPGQRSVGTGLILLVMYVGAAVLLSAALSAVLALVGSRVAGEGRAGFVGRFMLGLGLWLGLAALALAILMAPGARGAQLYGATAAFAAALVFLLGWTPLIGPIVERLDEVLADERRKGS